MKGRLANCLKINLTLMFCLSSVLWLESEASASVKQTPSAHLIERVAFDWSQSGKESTFSLFRQQDANGDTVDRLVIDSDGVRRWSLSSRDGQWASISEADLAHLSRQNLVSKAKHLLFVSSGSPRANTYLILKGVDSGCCVGSLTVLTPNSHGRPVVVFKSSSHLLAALDPTGDGNTLAMIGQSSDSEARALKNAQSYDPYRVYLLEGDQPARYDLARSKAYTLAHYCHWHGPAYDERFVAVGVTIGANHCQVMSESAFSLYRQKHPSLFPEH